MFFHCFQQGALGFRGGAVNFISQQYLGKDGAGMKMEGMVGWFEDGNTENIRRQHIAGKLDTIELQAQTFG